MPRPISGSEDGDLSDECASLLFPYRHVLLSDLGQNDPTTHSSEKPKRHFRSKWFGGCGDSYMSLGFTGIIYENVKTQVPCLSNDIAPGNGDSQQKQ